MKKNPLFYERCNSNKMKIAHAKRKVGLALAGLFAVAFMLTISIHNPVNAKQTVCDAGISLSSLALIPFAAGIKGDGESDLDFTARAGKTETPEAFTKRLMFHTINEAVKNATDATKAELEAIKTKLAAIKSADGLDELKAEMKKHGLAIEAIKETNAGRDRSIKKGSIAETLLINKEKIDSFITGKTARNLEIFHKGDAQTETSTDIINRTGYADWHEAGMIGQIPVRKPFIRELFKNAGTMAEYIKYTDQNTVVRDAQNVALCATSTGNTKATWIVRTDFQIQKVRDFVDICLDTMSNYLFVQGEIQRLLDSSVKLKIDDQLLVGTGVAPQLNSIKAIASTFAAANADPTADYAAKIQAATLLDLIAVAGAQIKAFGKNNKWNPNYVLLNPKDLQLLKLLKDKIDNYIKLNVMSTTLFQDNAGNCYVDGMLLVDNPNIPANEFYIGDFRYGTVYAMPGIGIEFSYENATNFETETVTVKAFERLNLLVRNVDVNAFMHCADIAAGIAAISSVPTP